MLVLSRKTGERLVIDAKITVTVIEVTGGQIRLGIEAPKEVPVRREEVAVRESVAA
ncbi:MAG: carbon storage regulator [Thermoguttaceae bacterium]